MTTVWIIIANWEYEKILPSPVCTRHWCSDSRPIVGKRRSFSLPARACSSREQRQLGWWRSNCRWWETVVGSKRKCCTPGCTIWRPSPCSSNQYRKRSCCLRARSCERYKNVLLTQCEVCIYTMYDIIWDFYLTDSIRTAEQLSKPTRRTRCQICEGGRRSRSLA